MNRVPANYTGGRPSNVPDPGQEMAPEGMTIMGVSVARIAAIPLQRWKYTLVLLALCTGIAILYAKSTSEISYKLNGVLTHQTPAVSGDVLPPPKTLETLAADLKQNKTYYEKLNEKFDLHIPLERFPGAFVIDRGGENTQHILVQLTWPESQQGADLVNELMKLHCKEVEQYRRGQYEKVLKTTTAKLKEYESLLNAAVTARDGYLRKHLVTGSPKDRRTELLADVTRADNLISIAESQVFRLQAEVRKLHGDIAELQRQEKAGGAKLDDDQNQAFRQQRDALKIELITIEQELKTNQRNLEAKEKEHQLKKPLSEGPRPSILPSVVADLAREVQSLRGAVKASEAKLAIRTRQFEDLRPSSARLRELKSKLADKQVEQETTRATVAHHEAIRDNLRDKLQKLQPVIVGWEPLEQEVLRLQKLETDLRTRRAELELRLEQVASELIISSPATPSLFPFSDFKKRVVMGFALPLLIGLGLLVVRDMASTAWRAETLAEKMHLPVLARSSRAGRRIGQAAGLTPETCRALALRVRQAMPESGKVVMVSSLNDNKGIDQLVSEVGRCLGMRNERVLILDARIAEAQPERLAAQIERRVDGRDLGVLPGETAAADPAAGLVGLVQCLVFSGFDATDFTYHTRIPGVDYLPAGGPYPVTDALASEPMADLLEALCERYTIIVVIGPSITKGIDTEILAAYVDGVLVVVNEPLGNAAAEAELVMRALEEKHAPLLGAVICV